MQIKHKILVIDDDLSMQELINDALTSTKLEVVSFSNGFDAIKYTNGLESFQKDYIDLIITDLKMPELDGISIIETFKRILPQTPSILMTAFGSIDTAIEATKKGAFYYLIKPFNLKELNLLVERAQQYKSLSFDNIKLKSQFSSSASFDGIIGKSKSMLSIFDLIIRVAPSNSNILINGESGTGKELIAKAIHKHSHRSNGPFVAINCTAIPENLLESELFGHAKGSFTGAINKKIGLFEEANGGTIFLDEIGDMAMSLQSKILRVIQERKVRSVGENIDRAIDVRIIAASHKDLKLSIKNQLFREDLYYRLSVIPILIPPLRHRTEDIPLLAMAFLEKYSLRNNKQISGFTNEAIQLLINQNWDGNVRELENVIERAVVLANQNIIGIENLPQNSDLKSESFYAKQIEELPTLENFEKRYIQYVLQKVGGKKEKAAHILGINRRTLYRKEKEYGWVEENTQLLEEVE